MRKIKDFLTTSNHWKHLVGGVVVGAGANGLYCAAYAGIGVAGALELKDKLYGNKWDWVDFSLTIGGVAIGYAVHWLVIE